MKTFQAFIGPRNASGLHPSREQCEARLDGARAIEVEISIKDDARFMIFCLGEPAVFTEFADAYRFAVENNLDTRQVRILERTRGEFYNDFILNDRARYIFDHEQEA